MIAFYIALALIIGISAGILLHQYATNLGQRRVIGRRLNRYTGRDE